MQLYKGSNIESMKCGEQGALHVADMRKCWPKIPDGPKWQWIMSYARVFTVVSRKKA